MIKQHGQGIMTVDESSVDTNLVFAKLDTKILSAEDLVQRLEQASFLKGLAVMVFKLVRFFFAGFKRRR